MAAMARCERGRGVGCLFVVLVVCFVVVVVGDPAGDRLVMQAFKAGITNSAGLGWDDPDPCVWNPKFVQCDAAGNVQQLRVRDVGLAGVVTPTLNQLSKLTYLELNFNLFTGPMPSLAGLSMLQTAFLDDCDFTSIPGDFFDGLSSIVELHLENNPNLNKTVGGWTLPASLEFATSLTIFSVTNAGVVGELPAFLGTLPALTTLEAAYNGLVGGIPESFQSSRIQVLKLNNQQMNGSITAVGGMVGLQFLWLQVNRFYGPVPVGLQDAGGLKSLRINDNQLVGRLPLGLAGLAGLTEAVMAKNKLTGELPAFAPTVVTTSDITTFCDVAGKKCSAKVDSLLDFLGAAGWPQPVAVTWIGPDPCKGWIGVSCDPASGEIVSIILQSYGLTGTISPSLANLTSLTTLVLTKNALTGPVPAELTTLPSLKTVDVSNNNLTGPLPVFPATVKFTYLGNPLLTGTPVATPPVSGTSPAGTPDSSPSGTVPSPVGNGSPVGSPSNGSGSQQTSKSSGIGPVIGGVVGGVIVAILAVFLVFFLCRRKRKKSLVNGMSIHPRGDSGSDSELMKVMVDHSYSSASHQATVSSYGDSLHSGTSSNDHQVMEQGNMFMSIGMLRVVTKNFSEQNILGRGGFGVVYRGELEDGTQIAVKRMEAAVVSSKGLNEFQSEIAVLTKVKHRHLVGLLGYCADGNERLLVYEYMPQGTLAQHLFEYRELQEKPLTWTMRLTIALDVARGIEYLHNLAHRSFIHRDLKPSNILLTEDFRAKVSDFGLVKLAPEGKFSVETRLAGTFGYLAPEYAVTGRVTTKADVFSFGVVLMELLTGRRALDETQSEENMHLVTWFQRMMNKNKNDFRSAVDFTMNVDDETYKTMSIVAELAGHCTSREPYQRPDMSHVVNVLAPLVEQWKPTRHHGGDEGCSSSEDVELSLPQALKQWQEFEYEGDTTMTQRFDDSKSSIPVRPFGFADSFTSTDGR
ncbi:hypothetical protein KC19_10G039400 [Ceratodon purpureus]|uniref:Protein kinase domain-containing protein n=1 Tax=Ceratodon purpureus TaxID=3225 RepID=A0A8T0GGW6_CERPU|nr:hypothetical protein KC19_10G039400 [Ceratodon purpureus]